MESKPSRPLRCLLISPLPPKDSDNGDAQYTRDLLHQPPDGCTYVGYQEAFDAGEIVEDASWRRTDNAHPPRGLRDAAVATLRMGLHLLRRSGALLPDPVRWWTIVGDFDVVHVHCMPTRLSGRQAPVVVTDSAGTFWFWTRTKDYDDRSAWKLLARERRAAKLLDYIHPSSRPDCASEALYFVDSGRRFARRLGASHVQMGVCPPGVPAAPTRSTWDGQPPTIAFVAHDFEVKGGPMVLEVYSRLRTTIPDLRLLVAGSPLPDPHIDGVTWLGRLQRKELYDRVYSRAHVFLYPTRFDAAPLVVMEALAHGLPVVAPDILALGELVKDRESGFLFEEDDVDGATDATRTLLVDRVTWERMNEAALDDFTERFSVDVRNAALGRAYRRAADHACHAGGDEPRPPEAERPPVARRPLEPQPT